MKILIYFVLVFSSLFSSEITKRVDIVLDISNQSKIKINCKRNGFLNRNFIDENVEYNAVVRRFCKDNEFDKIKFPTIIKVEEYEYAEHYLLFYLENYLNYYKDRYFSLNKFLDKNKFFILFDNDNVSYDNHRSYFLLPKKDLIFESFEIIVNSPNMIGFPTSRGEQDLTKYEHITLFKGNNISYQDAFLKAKDFIEKEVIFTNNYEIDLVTECIEGDIWTKKYGKNTNKKCKWIVK